MRVHTSRAASAWPLSSRRDAASARNTGSSYNKKEQNIVDSALASTIDFHIIMEVNKFRN